MFLGLNLKNVGFVGALAPFAASVMSLTGFDFAGFGVVQSWTVPNGVSQVTAKAWGSAGQSLTGQLGGYGSFVAGTFAVTPGQTLAIKIGFGGGTGYGVGGGYASVEYPSGLGNNPSSWLVAGGGGGVGKGAVASTMIAGGNAGFSGENGTRASNAALGGTGAYTGAGGPGGFGAPGTGAFGMDGALLRGGDAAFDLGPPYTAGGGGGGYYGGGGGGTSFSNNGGGGGGGSSIVSGCSSVTNTGMNFADPNWNGIAGITGNQGRVVLIYS